MTDHYPDPDNLDDWFPQKPLATGLHQRLGVIVGGSLSKGLDVKLDREQAIENLAVGRYVVVRGQHKDFFCMITDVALEATNPAIRSDPPDVTDPFLAAIYSGTAAFGTIHAAPMRTATAPGCSASWGSTRPPWRRAAGRSRSIPITPRPTAGWGWPAPTGRTTWAPTATR